MSLPVSILSRPRLPSRRFMQAFALFLVVSAALFTGFYGLSAWNQAANGIETDAVVVSREDDGDTLVVEFTTESGELVRADVDQYVYAGHVGDSIRVRYLPDDPKSAKQAEEPPVKPVFFVIGGFFLLASLGLVVYAWRFAPPDRSGDGPFGSGRATTA